MGSTHARPESFRDYPEEFVLPVPVERRAKARSRDEAPPKLVRFAKPVAQPKTEREEILGVLGRAAAEPGFIAELTYRGSAALEGYNLSLLAKAALVSGDVQWIEARVGKLDARLRKWLDCRLQQEIW